MGLPTPRTTPRAEYVRVHLDLLAANDATDDEFEF
jgi:hypothetical protein